MADGMTKESKYDLLCIGTALVDSIIRGFDPVPVSAAGFRAESASLNVGGEAVNVSMAAAKLGLKTGICCHLGLDGAGDMVLDALKRTGVDTAAVLRDASHPTPVTTMFVNADGSRKSITNDAHRYNFHPEQSLKELPEARAYAIGSLFRAPFNDRDVVREVITELKKRGSLILADTKLPNFQKLSLEDIADILPLIDCIFPNEDEAKYYSGKDDPEEAAEVFLSYGIPNVVIKLGADGCLFKNKKERIRLTSYPIKAVDATGAGDNFLAGFAAELLGGASYAEALSFGNACGAICTTAAGASAGLRSKAQVLELINCKTWEC